MGTAPKVYDNDYIWLYPTSRKDSSGTQCFAIDWPSYLNDAIVQIFITGVKIGEGEWSISNIGIPEKTPKSDLEEIARAKWLILPSTANVKCPPVRMAWSIGDPPVVILACEQAEGVEEVSLKAQLNQMDEESELDPAKYSIINTLRRLGPASCTIISEFGRFEVQISKKGLFYNPKSLPSSAALPPGITPEESSDRIAAYIRMLTILGTTLMLVRKVTEETVCVRSGKDGITPVKVKELHGFMTNIDKNNKNNMQSISWRKLTPVETRRMCSEINKEAGGSVKLELGSREYRFI